MNLLAVETDARWAVTADAVTLRTERVRQFIDVTELVGERVRRSGVRHGIVSVASRHTTMGVVVNENEPLLLDDFAQLLDRAAPGDLRYGHDDFARREGIGPDERVNGAAHCRSLILGASQTLQVIEGTIALGRWQRVFLVELDGPQERTLSILVIGLGGGRV